MNLLYSFALKWVFLCSIATINCRVASNRGNVNGRRIRHHGSAQRNTPNSDMGDRELARLQADILNNLGMSEPPSNSNHLPVPEYARQLAVQEAAASNNQHEQTHEDHFMESSANLLLIARKGNV